MAVVLRVLLLPLPPTLSDDVLRYVWDGKVVIAGFNPYELPPESSELAALRDPMWERMPHKEVPTVYPPLALAVFAAGVVLPWPIVGVKILLSLAELVGCFLLLRLAVALGLPPGRATWFCWHPLVALEVAGMGHVDALVVAGSVAAVALIVAGHPGRAGLAATIGVLGKLVPLVALPFWALTSRRPWLVLAAAGSAIVLAILPVVVGVGGVPPGLVEYGISWEFNGPIYEPMWRLFDRLELDDTVKSGLDRMKILTGRHDVWNRIYPFVYPQLLAKATLLGIFGLLFLHTFLNVWRSREPVAASGRIFGAVALAMATFYPWYLLWILPWAALTRHKAWLVASFTLPLAYLPQVAGFTYFPGIWLAVWAPFFLLLPFSSWSLD